jgi:alkylated DNA nucleotide flippase Atl1
MPLYAPCMSERCCRACFALLCFVQLCSRVATAATAASFANHRGMQQKHCLGSTRRYHAFIGKMYVTHCQNIHKHMCKHHQAPWSNIVKNHGQTSSNTWSTIIQKHGQQLSKTMVNNHQTTWSNIVKKASRIGLLDEASQAEKQASKQQHT